MQHSLPLPLLIPEGPMPIRHPLGPDRRLQISDTATLQLLANATRLQIIDHLYAVQQPMTATELTHVVPLKSSAISYHLRLLSEHGLLDRIPHTRDGRERPWQAVAAGYSLVASSDADLDTRVALLDGRLNPMRHRMLQLLSARSKKTTTDDTDTYMVLATGASWLTDNETSQMVAELENLFARYEALGRDERRPGTRRTHYMWSILPDEDTDQQPGAG